MTSKEDEIRWQKFSKDWGLEEKMEEKARQELKKALAIYTRNNKDRVVKSLWTATVNQIYWKTNKIYNRFYCPLPFLPSLNSKTDTGLKFKISNWGAKTIKNSRILSNIYWYFASK